MPQVSRALGVPKHLTDSQTSQVNSHNRWLHIIYTGLLLTWQLWTGQASPSLSFLHIGDRLHHNHPAITNIPWWEFGRIPLISSTEHHHSKLCEHLCMLQWTVVHLFTACLILEQSKEHGESFLRSLTHCKLAQNLLSTGNIMSWTTQLLQLSGD
jgi:hypothetical protein